MNNTFNDDLPMPQNDDMPPLPGIGEVGPQVCATVQLYLGVMDDLTAEQVAIIQEHVRGCPDCARVQGVMQGATHVFGSLPDSMPSSRVDEAVMAAIAARRKGGIQGDAILPGTRRGEGGVDERKGPLGRPGEEEGTRATTRREVRDVPRREGRGRVRLGWGAIAAAAIAAVRIDAHGASYRVNTYYDPGSGRQHVETVMPGSMDVVAVGDGHSVLGMDMMHHVAQHNANVWSTDESMFNLAEIRSDLKANRAVFMGKDVFRGEPVYRILCSNGLVLLLDMQYKPVNVLRGVGSGSGEPVYDAIVLMPPSHVSSQMWDMRVPPGFKMGELPGKP
ncbi:MAG: hypothetical protein AUH94_01930 [Ktedonobacter sp. 13_2_20CM_2_54_8]|nr:MAG: hypothetical protein AUH94_01930 [Ktedonobacter sp. 13_2_20CM_2_54_8]